MTEIGERLQQVADRVGGVPKLAERSDLKATTIYGWIKGPGEPRASDLRQIADRAPCDLLWLLTGEPSQGGFAEEQAVYAPPRPAGEGFVYIPRLSVAASAGPGAIAGSEEVVGELAFRRELLRELGVSAPGALRVLTANGDSMEPLIRPGDLLLVDTGIDQVTHEGVYVVVFNGAVLVKRLAIDPKGVIYLVSENPRVPAMKVEREDRHEITIAGRVVRVIRAL